MRRRIVTAVITAAFGPGSVLLSAGPAHAEATELCRFDGTVLAEISGLAYSALHEGIVWAHNDSGGGSRLYAIDVDDCEIRAVLRVKGVKASDPEAIASGTAPTGAPALWWGDIGDNTSARNFIEIHLILEPANLQSQTVSADSFKVRLDDRQDSEALLADGDRLWLIGKGLLGGNVWRLPQPLRPDETARARVVGTEEALVTDAAMRPGGGYAVRDYSEVRIYSGSPPGALQSRMPLPEQVQGEAMTWTPDGRALIIASEGDDRLLLVPVGGAAPSQAASPSPAPPPSFAPSPAPTSTEVTSARPAPEVVEPTPVAAALEPVDRIGNLAVLALALGAAVFVVSAIAVAVVARWRSRH